MASPLLAVKAERVVVVVEAKRVVVVGVTAIHGRVKVVVCDWYGCGCT